MTNIGGAFFEISADVSAAIDAVEQFRKAARQAFAQAASDIDTKAFAEFVDGISDATGVVVATGRALRDLDGIIREIQQSTKGFIPDEAVQNDLANLRQLREEAARGIGIPTGTLKEQKELQAALFELETRGAHEAALAKERAFEVSKKVVKEERAIQEALFLSVTQGAHEMAVAKERAYEQAAQAAEKAAKEERAAQERLGAELAASINRVNPRLAQERQKEFDLLVARASGIEKVNGRLSASFADLASKGGLVGSVAGKLTGVFAGAEKVLDRFGLSVSEVSILLGAGFAGGIAGVIQVGIQLVQTLARMAVAAAKLFVDLARLGAEIQTFRDRLQAGFGEGARIIEEFAQGSARSFGLTERAAIELTGTMGNLFQSFGVGQQLAAQLGVDLASAALIIQRTSFTTDTYEQVLGKLKGALTGNVEALREYGIAVNETSLRQTAQAHGIQLIAGEMDAATKALLSYLFVTDQASQRQDEFNKSTESVLTEQEKLNAAFEQLKTSIGEDLTPLFRDLVVAGQGVVEFLGGLYDAVVSVIKPIFDLTGAVSDLLNIPEVLEALGIGSADSDEAFEKFARGLGAIEEEIRAFGGVFGPDEQQQIDAFREKTNELFNDFVAGKINADQFFTILAAGLDISPAEAQRQYRAFFNAIAAERPELEKYRDALFDTSFAQEEAAEAARKHQEELRNQPEFLKRLRDAYQNLADTLEDNAKRLKDAQEAVRDARIEGRKSVQDALEDLDEARVEGVKDIINAENDQRKAEADAAKAIEKARENLADAEEERLERIADAREKLREVEKDGQESIRDAEENLREARLDAVKRVDEAERRLADARQQRVDQFIDAQLGLEEALRRGDASAFNAAQVQLARARSSKGVMDAQRSLAETRVEANEKIADAEEKLQEVIEDVAEKIKDAREDLAETIEDQNERVKDAEENLAETIVEQNERVTEAIERMVETREKAKERILDAQERLDVAEEKAIKRLDEAKEKLREVRDENQQRLEEAKRKVEELEGTWGDVNEQVRLLRDQIGDLKSRIAELQGLSVETNVVIGGVVKRQHGGPFRMGQPFIAGEHGLPELVIPGASGVVASNRQILEALRSLGGGKGGVNQSITVIDSGDPDVTAEIVAARLIQGLNN